MDNSKINSYKKQPAQKIIFLRYVRKKCVRYGMDKKAQMPHLDVDPLGWKWKQKSQLLLLDVNTQYTFKELVFNGFFNC